MNVPNKHKAIAHAWVDGAEIEGRKPKAAYHALNEWRICKNPTWHKDWEYRIKPTKPSIDWEHVASEYVALVTDKSGDSYLFTEVPKAATVTWMAACPCTVAEVFQSFVKGTCDWKGSLVIRPSADSEETEPRHE